MTLGVSGQGDALEAVEQRGMPYVNAIQRRVVLSG